MVCNCECDNCTDKMNQIRKKGAWSWEGVSEQERWVRLNKNWMKIEMNGIKEQRREDCGRKKASHG